MDNFLDSKISGISVVQVVVTSTVLFLEVRAALRWHSGEHAENPDVPRTQAIGRILGAWVRVATAALLGLGVLRGSGWAVVLFCLFLILGSLKISRQVAAGLARGYAQTSGQAIPNYLRETIAGGYLVLTRGSLAVLLVLSWGAV